MGLYAFEVAIIKDLLPKPFKALSFGHPDILAKPDELGMDLPVCDTGLDRAKIPEGVVGSAKNLFEALGGDILVADRYKGFGVDEIVDLNFVFPRLGEFDLVIDPGTSEHCFNVGSALVNMARHVKVGGHIYHMVPMCHWNHGFWNFSPCAFADFYEQNGFRIKALRGEYRTNWKDVAYRAKFEVPNNGRKLNLMCIATRVEAKTIDFPLQYKYATK